MISEVSFSRGYTSFWTEYTPWIGDFVGSINKGMGLQTQSPITVTDDAIHRSINNIIAFTIFKNIVKFKNDNIEDAKDEAFAIAKNYPRNNLETYSFTNANYQVIKQLANRLAYQYKDKVVEFYPQFWGCGILESCQGDLHYDDTLVEIKAGERGLLSSDIKQIITYSALNWLSRKPMIIKQIEFYNPRQGILWKSNLNDMILSISNLPPADLFDQIGKYLSVLSEDIDL